MKTELTLTEWRENLNVQHRFRNFWASVSSVKIGSQVRDDTVRAIIEAMERVRT